MITITIGRNNKNIMQVPEEFRNVSREHGKIEYFDNGEIKFTDFSTFGTMINGQYVQNKTVDINIGDEIILGNECVLNWEILKNLLPQETKGGKETVIFYGDEKSTENIENQEGKKTVIFYGDDSSNENIGGKKTVILGNGKKTELFNNNVDKIEEESSIIENSQSQKRQKSIWTATEIRNFTKRWNWGAFFLSFIWGCFHKIYWPLYIMAANLVVSVLPLFVQGENLIIAIAIITWIVHLAVFVAAVYLGINGSNMAWNRDVCNKNLTEFKKKEKRWAKAGFITFSIGILILIVGITILIDKI